MKTKIILATFFFAILSCSPTSREFYFKNGKIGLNKNSDLFIYQILTSNDIHEYKIYENGNFNTDSVNILDCVYNKLDTALQNKIFKNGIYIKINLKRRNSDEIYDQHSIKLNLKSDSIIKSFPVRI